MAIPNNQMMTIELHMQGIVAAGGSTTRQADFVFHFNRGLAPALPLVLAGVEAAFNAAIAVPILAMLNARFTQTFNTVRCLDDALQQAVQVPRAGVGGVAGDSMPMHNSCFILMRTALRGKRYRGSKKLFPMSEADTTGGTDDLLNAAALVRVAAAITAMGTQFTDAAGNIWRLTIVSKQPPTQILTNPTVVTQNLVTQILPNKRLGRMRSREVRSQY